MILRRSISSPPSDVISRRATSSASRCWRLTLPYPLRVSGLVHISTRRLPNRAKRGLPCAACRRLRAARGHRPSYERITPPTLAPRTSLEGYVVGQLEPGAGYRLRTEDRAA